MALESQKADEPTKAAENRENLGSAARPFDLIIIGGGVNGCGIARDAAGRGLTVKLVEMQDLGGATSSASTKLFHGGLRYLEHFKFRLVREALQERAALLEAMPHIAWPMRFVLPIGPGQKRPAWLLRLGLFLYDRLGGKGALPGTQRLNLMKDAAGAPLKPDYAQAFEYSDGWVDDARLVILNARDAADRGAVINARTRLERAERENGLWRAVFQDMNSGGASNAYGRALINAAGPWAADVLNVRLLSNSKASVRLVRGSHIVVKRMFDHEKCYLLQQPDGRIVFAIPYEGAFTLIGTTDIDHDGPADTAACSPEEQAYLINAVNRYFAAPLAPDAIVWTYSGVRPLFDDGSQSAASATRDYVLELQGGGADAQAPLLNVFGGKITTYRRLAEAALTKLAGAFPDMGASWTKGAALPGGDFPADDADDIKARLKQAYPFLEGATAERLFRAYGLDAFTLLGDARSPEDLGAAFGPTLRAREVDWLCQREWAETAEDILWRRSKLGLQMPQTEVSALAAYLNQSLSGSPEPSAEQDEHGK